MTKIVTSNLAQDWFRSREVWPCHLWNKESEIIHKHFPSYIYCKIIQRENGNFKNLDRRNLARGLKLLFGWGSLLCCFLRLSASALSVSSVDLPLLNSWLASSFRSFNESSFELHAQKNERERYVCLLNCLRNKC